MTKKQPQKKIALAMQAGGASGAFTWGVLDALLEDGRFEITGVSGASAGSINSVLLAQGLAEGDMVQVGLEHGQHQTLDWGHDGRQFEHGVLGFLAGARVVCMLHNGVEDAAQTENIGLR